MALGKARSSKRSSSLTSYVSTITVVIFVASCVIGLWMLTSSTLIPRQSTRTSNDISSADSHLAKVDPRKDAPAFGDAQRDLPDDALKGDDVSKAADEPKQTVETTNIDAVSQDDSQSLSLLLPENRSDPVVESHAEGETEQENIVANKNDEVATTTANEEKDQKEDETQQRTEESAGAEQQGKEETDQVTKESNQNQENQQQLQETTGDQEISDQASTETEETRQQREETEGNKSQDQTQQITEEAKKETSQQELEIESHENTEQSQQQTFEGDHQQAQQEIVESKISEVNSIPQAAIQEAINDETQQQEQQEPEQQTQTTDNQQSQEIREEENKPDENEESQQSESMASQNKETRQQSEEKGSGSNQKTQNETTTEVKGETFPVGAHSEIPKESKESKKTWSTQADQSENEKERRKGESNSMDGSIYGYTWELCNVTAGPDYIPCLDNEKALRQLRTTKHYEHRERHCPDESPSCLVPLPEGYRRSIEWPKSRDKIWYHNVPHTKLAEVKGHQNWVKVTGEFLTFPGGGTQFIHGALHYIDFIQQSVPNIAWGKRTRVILDVGCGVASFGGYLFERDVLTMSFAPKDEHEAQVQFALERGIPAISAVMGTQRLPFPSRVFDLVHCARCRVPWHVEGGALLLELNRVLRPGGYFVWSATPVYQKLPEDVEIWKAMSALTVSMCWDLFTIKNDKLNSIGAAIYRKPTSNECYDNRKQNSPPMCKDEDDPNAAWYVPLQSCMHRVPVDGTERGSQWPEEWPKRLETPPFWLNRSQMGVYGKPAPDDFSADYEHWKRVVTKSYLTGLGISWSNVRNVMDMRAVYGGFAAALRDLQVWVLNVVNIDSPDTLPIIYERGLFGIYHDWCESFSTYPRSYDLLHADHLFSKLKKRCKLAPVIAEIDRIVKPGGKLIIRDDSTTMREIENILKSLHWEIHLTFSKNKEGILSAQKSDWRPATYAASF
ncbi:PREDICTED: probable methyltransferase PMT27 isoform X1 [Nelumbo nucifera]|uniref:Methyltransferase PMT27 n=3 Tax=Nelumbo nucifera TaxID=4432 RepID=A0A822Z5M9_NELNU|nr:PREDICTED: probable methyltransferase PMT27 isoform X1 [Nelumbo nucifera]DAD40382.1 TPA_asm: hypothetical protein HUJ06_014705 [Nelumbo nucifera]